MNCVIRQFLYCKPCVGKVLCRNSWILMSVVIVIPEIFASFSLNLCLFLTMAVKLCIFSTQVVIFLLFWDEIPTIQCIMNCQYFLQWVMNFTECGWLALPDIACSFSWKWHFGTNGGQGADKEYYGSDLGNFDSILPQNRQNQRIFDIFSDTLN